MNSQVLGFECGQTLEEFTTSFVRSQKTEAAMSKKADSDTLGPLADFVGTWEGSSGYNVIAVPSQSLQSEDAEASFKLLYQKYKETLTFTPVDGTARNRLGAMDQLVGALSYEQVIHAVDDPDHLNSFKPGDLIHQETGMLLYLNNVNGQDNGTSTPPYAIARSGTIPHGNSIMLLGEYPETSQQGPKLPVMGSIPSDLGSSSSFGYTDPYLNAGPYASYPNQALTDATKGQTINKTVTFSLNSANQGASPTPPFVNTYAPATAATCQYWLETVQNDDGTSFLQLQYSQNVSIVFGKKLGTSTGKITWPHITVDTLIKTSE